MDPFLAFKIGATGLAVQRLRINLIASNIANIETTRTLKGTPYRRKDLIVMAMPVIRPANSNNPFEEKLIRALKAVIPVEVVEDSRPFKLVYKPSHPDADDKGYVRLPNVNPIEEMVNMISALRAYEANITVINNTKMMMIKALEIGR